MKRVIAILLATAVITGCSNNGKFVSKSSTNQCGGNGWTHAIVHYGDSRVVVVPLSDVRAGQEMRFFLIPQWKGRGASNYQNATVKIKGKSSAPWFTEIEGDASNLYIHTCVPPTLAIGATFEYQVDIHWPTDAASDRKAMLDPRAVVIN